MNGFTNSMITLLLGWMKALISDLWQLLSGEKGGALLGWLAANWKVLVVLLCAGGFVMDRIIYFIRWRPDYVWRSRRERRRQRRLEREPAEENWRPNAPQEELPAAAYTPDPPAASYAPQSTRIYQSAGQAPYEPQEELSPVYDDEPIQWQPEEEPGLRERYGMQSSFGTPRPEPIEYLRDVQAGFAPPQTPQQMYAPPASSYAPPVHPGLDDDALRQNFGLDQQAWRDPLEEENLMQVPTWQAFPQQEAPKPGNPLLRFAQKARDLVTIRDEENAPSIHDLRPSVDRSQAFHKPVYPKPRAWQDGDDE